MKPYAIEFVAEQPHEVEAYVDAFEELIKSEISGAKVERNKRRTIEYSDREFESIFVFVYGADPEFCEAAQDYAYQVIFGS